MVSLYDEGPFSPCPAPFNMAGHVLAAGQRTPKKEALIVVSSDHATRWRYADLSRAVLGTATGLRRFGLSPGDIVLLRLGNTVDFPLAYLGALAAGLVPVPTSATLTEREVAHVINLLNPAVVIRAPQIACPDVANALTLADLQAYRSLPPTDFHMGDPNRMGYVIFTSGTSGEPRAVAHAHRAIWARQMMFEGWYGLRTTDRLLHAGAFNWTYTMGTGLMDPWTIGATALIAAPDVTPADIPALLRQHEVSIFAAAPGIYRKILNQSSDLKIPTLRHGLSAGEKLPPSTRNSWQQATGVPVFEAYGMSECSTFISQAPGAVPCADTLGYPQKGRRIALLRDGVPVRRGEEGTIAVDRSDPGLMLGYLHAKDATTAKMHDTWFLTGDQAIMQPDGAITYMGRNDDMMNAGGFRVSPLEVETVLAKMPGVSAVAATSVPIKSDAEVIAAFYTGPVALDEADLRSYVAERLARYKQPRLYVHLPELPQGANGKIMRRVLRARFERSQ